MFACIIFSLFIKKFSADAIHSQICPDIITKSEWGARGATKIHYSVIPIEHVIIHHTFTPQCVNAFECSDLLTSMQNFHMDDLKYDDIAYNFLIGGDGKVYEGCGWHKIGAHTKGYNSRSIAIAFVGTFTKQLPNAEQLKMAKGLIECGVKIEELSKNYKLYGARQLSATQSPGLMLYNEIQKWPHFTKRL